MNKINFKQPKYILPLVTLLPVLFLAHTIMNFSGKGNDTPKKGVATDSINMSLPAAENVGIGDKMSDMNQRMSEDGAYTAVDGIGDEDESKDSTTSGYSEKELDNIDAANADRKRQQKQMEDMERSLAESRKHINSYAGSGSSSGSSQQEEYGDYAREIAAIQRRSVARQRAYEKSLDRNTGGTVGGSDTPASLPEGRRKGRLRTVKPEIAILHKVQSANEDQFHTLASPSAADEPLIRAMIDKTTRAHEGTRLRFKLLDDVTLKGMTLRKGTYLYGIVTGFGQQRVKASITSILVKDKFIRVSLSVYDNDGMAGFYVPESAFRDMMKEAGAQAMQNNVTFDNGGGSGLSGESIALQTLQNMYQSASNAVANNIRKNKARIKYNTIVYLINTGNNE